MKYFWYAITSLTAVGLLVIIGLLVAPKSPVPPEIRRQLTFALLVPDSKLVTVERSSVKYDASQKILSFAASAFGTTLIFSEQPVPDSFTDIPEYYSKLTAAMGEYKAFDSTAGTVHLTKPEKIKGQQTAVLISAGTLVFVKAENNLTEDQWRLIFKTVSASK